MALRDLWQSLRAEFDDDVADVEEHLPTIGWLLFGYSIVVAALVVTAVHFVASWGLTRGGLMQTVVLMLIFSIALALIAVLIWAHWETRKDAENMRTYLIAIVASAVTIGVAAQAFAALNVYLSLRGLVSSEATPSFWRAEISYFWHFLDAVPLVDIPSTLQWEEPAGFRDHTSGVLLLLFKLAVIIPAIGLGFECYRALEEERRRADQRPTSDGYGPFDVAERISLGPGGTASVFALLAGVALGIYFASPALFESTSRLNLWLDRRIPDSVDVRDVNVPLSWTEVLPQAIAITLLLYVAAIVVFLAFFVHVGTPRAAWRLIGPLGAWICLIILLAELWSLLTLTLLHWGLASADPPLASGDEVPSTIRYYLWHAVDVIPALDVPETLNLTLPVSFVDRGSAGLLLAFEVMFLVVLAFPVMRQVRSYSAARRREEP